MYSGQQEILKLRNRFLNQVIGAFLSFQLVISICRFFFGTVSLSVVLMTLTLTVIILPIGFWLYKKDYQNELVHFNLLASILAVFTIVYLGDSLSSLFYIFSVISFLSVQENFKSSLIGATSAVFYGLYFHFYKPELFEVPWTNSSTVDLVLAMMLVMWISTHNVRLGNQISKKLYAQQEEADMLVARNDHILESVKNSMDVTNAFNETLHEHVERTEETGVIVASTVEQMTIAIGEQNRSIYEIDEKVKSFFRDLDTVEHAVHQTNEFSEETNLTVKNVRGTVESLNQSIGDLMHTMDITQHAVDSLMDSSERIFDINKSISTIAEKTNLLSLNAAIEAARAGEHGKGFGVVAEEIKKLANQASLNANDVNNILSNVLKEMEKAQTATTDSHRKLLISQEKTKDISDVFDGLAIKNNDMVISSQESKNKVVALQDNARKMVEEISNVSAISEENESSIEEVLTKVELMKQLVIESKNHFQELNSRLNDLSNDVMTEKK